MGLCFFLENRMLENTNKDWRNGRDTVNTHSEGNVTDNAEASLEDGYSSESIRDQEHMAEGRREKSSWM